jgi:hypothetical protein
MTGETRGTHEVLVHAVRGLVAEARSERALLPADSAERQFYLGVEAAAELILQPQLAASRNEQWLERQGPDFRDGYLRTSHVLELASTAPEPPMRIRMPSARPAR